MNETDYLRQQLALERNHLQEILQAVRSGNEAVGSSRAVADYIDWAGRRVLGTLNAQCAALRTAPATGAKAGAQLQRLSGAAALLPDGGSGLTARIKAERLLALMAAWSEPLERLAGATLRIAHWRQAAQLSADTILQERQLYAAARAAVGLS
jgi:hypothetical protein